MNTQVNDNAIDEIVATCNGDIRGALKALMLVNEQLESELQQLYAAVGGIAPVERGTSALH
jgi:replication-associated recombination protein RarA